MNNAMKITLASVAAIVLLVLLLRDDAGSKPAPSDASAKTGEGSAERKPAERAELMVYCAAGIKGPVEAVAKQYEQEYGVEIHLQYDGSGTLLNSLQVAKQGDLFVSADRSYIEIARGKDLVDEALPVAHQHPVIAVSKGNPKKIQTIKDLAREDVKVSLANPEAASVGKQIRKALAAAGEWDTLKAAVENRGVFKPTVNQVANDIKLGAVDAGIIWDSTCAQYPDLEAVEAPVLEKEDCEITVGVLRFAKNPTAALRFARYLTAADRGLPAFKKDGYVPVKGDLWEETPELNFFSGGVNRPAIEKTLEEFKAREGCRIVTTYNGCGILVGQMRAGARPDAYLACDNTFADNVQDLFEPMTPVSAMEMIILVQKGNPHGIKSLKDLANPGLKVGLGHPEQAAFGKLTKDLLAEEGLLDGIMKNCVSQAPAGDMLVNQMSAGSLDASICYIANAMSVKEKFEMIPIPNPKAKAFQPFQISKASKHPYLAARLRDAILSARSQQRYKEAGFSWKAPANRGAHE